MAPQLPFRIETFDSLPSTQDLMRERLEQGANVHGLVIRAIEQTAARGQRARDWQSSAGGSYQTLAINFAADPPVSPLKGGTNSVPIVLAIGLAQTLPEYGIQLGIKWPNDVHYRNKKVGGILCELVRGHLLIGVGINVNNPVPEGAIALRGLDVEGVSNMVLAGLQRGLELLTIKLDLPTAFATYDVLKDQQIELNLDGVLKRGIARGIDEQGCLKLECRGGLEPICNSQARGSIRWLR